MNALFGDLQYTLAVTPKGPGNGSWGRKMNGAWTSERGPRYKRNSGILVAKRLTPWSIARTDLCLYHNPYAYAPCERVLDALTEWKAVNNKGELSEGKKVWEIFNLSREWPE